MNKAKNLISNITKKRSTMFWGTLSAAFVLKYLIYGFNYFPILDDYIQYGGYPMYEDISYVLFDIGTAASRPLAAFLDVAFWGKLWNFPQLMLISSCLFHFLSCVFFYKTAEENNIEFSPIFAVFYLFFPLGSEGSIWISASSRIVVGLFFVSLALFLLTKYEKHGKIYYFIFFFVFALCSFALYEACAVFCFMTAFLILVINKREKLFLSPFISLCILLLALLIYMKSFENIGRMGSRASSSSLFLVFTQAGDFLAQLLEIMTKGAYETIVNGFTSGLGVLFNYGILGIAYLFVIFVVCIIIGRTFTSESCTRPHRKKLYIRIAIGILLFFAPFAPNLISEPVWISYRTMFIPLIGLYIIFDVVFSAISKKSIQTVLLMAIVFIFTVSSINEYDTYKRTNELDKKLLDTVCSQLPENVLAGNQEIAVLLDSPPNAKQVSYYKDHVKTVFHEDWALTGAVRAYTNAITIKKVTPVYPDMTFDYSDCFVVDLRTK